MFRIVHRPMRSCIVAKPTLFSERSHDVLPKPSMHIPHELVSDLAELRFPLLAEEQIDINDFPDDKQEDNTDRLVEHQLALKDLLDMDIVKDILSVDNESDS